MIPLRPFDPSPLNHSNKIKIEADLQLSRGVIEIQFNWQDDGKNIDFESPFKPGRQMGLWEYTCFEAFVKPSENDSVYYEFNFHPNGAWNSFKFKSYRDPQPPFELNGVKFTLIEHIESNGEILKVSYAHPEFNFAKVKLSVCAVIQQKNQKKFYWAGHHADSKPNFHHIDSFKIERSVK